MSTNVFGNAPNQVPTNADLGGMAYQDPRYVVVTGGNVNPTNFGTSNAQILFGNITGIQNLAAVAGRVTTLVADNFSAGNINMAGTTVTSGTVNITNATDSTGPSTGALKITGGAGILGNVHIAGNLYVTGNTFTLGTENVAIQDSIIELHTFANLDPLGANDGRDIGIKFHYYDVADSVAFLGRANDTGSLEWYAKGTEGVGNVFIGSNYGTIKAGEIVLANTTAATSTTTGALQVGGGVGIADGLYVNGTTLLERVSTANAVITGGYIQTVSNIYASGVGNFGSVISTNVTATGGSITGGTGAFSTLVATNFSSGNIYQLGDTQSIQTANAQIGTNWGIVARANLFVANVSGMLNSTNGNITTLSAPNFSSGNIYQSAAGTLVATNFSSGNIYQSAAGTLVATNFSSGNVRITGGYATGMANVTAGNLYVTNLNTLDYASNALMPKAYVDAIGIIFGV
jgi:hypothetical protein